MNKYLIKFNGRLVGSVGLVSYHEAYISADNVDSAIIKLYDTYEHIWVHSVTKVK